MDTSYLTQQVTTIIAQLHNLFDEIGVPKHEREARESELFSSLSETLHSHLRVVANEKDGMVEEAQRVVTVIRQMECALDGTKSNDLHAMKEDDTLCVTYPLAECLATLKAKHKAVSKLHQERYEQIKKLLQALESYSSHLEPSFLRIPLPPPASSTTGAIPPTFDLSPSYITSIDTEFTRVYEEYTKRTVSVQQTAEEIVTLWAELGTPQAQIDGAVVQKWRDMPEQLGLHEEDMARLRGMREKLRQEKAGRERKLVELKTEVEALWERLSVDERERKVFLAGTRGCGLRAVNDLEDELSRLHELKRQNLHLFVEDARATLQKLWDELYVSEEEAVEFTPVFCDVYSDALLSAHESEISRLETLKEQRAPTLQLIAKHRSLIQDREDLAASSQDASRLMLKPQKGEKRDPTRLLREEKMRKRIAKELPKVEQELRKMLEQFEDEYGRPFLVFGERYLDATAPATGSSAKVLPPRSKTPNALPAPAKAPKPIGSSGPRVASTREPATLRSKTPVGTVTRIPAATASTTNSNRSPSRIPARVPLGAMPHGGNSPERLHLQHSQLGKENSGTLRKAGPPTMAPPPKMRDIRALPPQPMVTSTPSTTSSIDFSRSGSIVRHVPPEDPYNDDDHQHSHHFTNPSSIHQQTPQPRLQAHRAMPPPSNNRPTYHDPRQQQQPLQPQHHHYTYADHSTVSSVPSSITSGLGSRQISAASTTGTALSHGVDGGGGGSVFSGSENWESYEDGEGEGSVGEAEGEGVEGGEAYWRRVKTQQQQQQQQQARGMRNGFGRGGGGAGFKGAVGVGMGIGASAVGVGAGREEVSETGWTDEDGIE